MVNNFGMRFISFVHRTIDLFKQEMCIFFCLYFTFEYNMIENTYDASCWFHAKGNRMIPKQQMCQVLILTQETYDSEIKISCAPQDPREGNLHC